MLREFVRIMLRDKSKLVFVLGVFVGLVILFGFECSLQSIIVAFVSLGCVEIAAKFFMN